MGGVVPGFNLTEKEISSRVTRRGQVTIPVEFRKARGIREGSRVIFSSKGLGELSLKSTANLEDLADIDSGKISYKEAIERLDRMRENDRY